MANTATETMIDPASPAGEEKRGPGRILLRAGMGVLVVALAVGAAAGWVKWQKAHHGADAATTAAKPAAAESTHLVEMDPFLVNLADESGQSYLRVSVTLAVADAPGAKKESEGKDDPAAAVEKAAARDSILNELAKMHSDELLMPGGQALLKQRLMAALLAAQPKPIAVRAVYVTDLLVQKG
jgi:flagellar FliL protein